MNRYFGGSQCCYDKNNVVRDLWNRNPLGISCTENIIHICVCVCVYIYTYIYLYLYLHREMVIHSI